MLNHNVGFQSETHRDAGWLEQYTMPNEFDTSAPERRKTFGTFFLVSDLMHGKKIT